MYLNYVLGGLGGLLTLIILKCLCNWCNKRSQSAPLHVTLLPPVANGSKKQTTENERSQAQTSAPSLAPVTVKNGLKDTTIIKGKMTKADGFIIESIVVNGKLQGQDKKTTFPEPRAPPYTAPPYTAPPPYSSAFSEVPPRALPFNLKTSTAAEPILELLKKAELRAAQTGNYEQATKIKVLHQAIVKQTEAVAELARKETEAAAASDYQAAALFASQKRDAQTELERMRQEATVLST